MLTQLAITAVAIAGGLTAAAPAEQPAQTSPDRLTISVADTGNGAKDGTFELTCHPAGGNHPMAQEACDRLDKLFSEGTDPFAPVPTDQMCTMQYGGPATAHISGAWAGRAIDAKFNRTDGCEIHRWEQLNPVLPLAS